MRRWNCFKIPEQSGLGTNEGSKGGGGVNGKHKENVKDKHEKIFRVRLAKQKHIMVEITDIMPQEVRI